MTTRINTPGPARDQQRIVLRDKPRDAASMEGWRIEVVGEDAYGDGEHMFVTRPNGDPAQLTHELYVLAPGVYRDVMKRDVLAAADPLFETIYVSRELTGDEPDTLRRLMAEEVARERERERHPLLTGFFETQAYFAASGSLWSNTASAPLSLEGTVEAMKATELMVRQPVGVCTGTTERDGETLYAVQIGAPVVTMHDAEREQRKAKMRDALDKLAANPSCVTFAVYDGLRHWSCPKCKVMIGDFAIESRAFKHHCGFDSEASTAPRVPKVGEEIETWVRTTGQPKRWFPARVSDVIGGELVIKVAARAVMPEQTDPFIMRLPINSSDWRWPEAKREAFVPVGPTDNRIFKRRAW